MMSAVCRNCKKRPGSSFEYCVKEEWFAVDICDDCSPLFVNALMPLVRISDVIDTRRSPRYNGRLTRGDVETGRMKAVGSTLTAPLLMGLRVTGGIPDLIGRVVQAKFTEDEVLKVAAFLISRPHWAHAINAMLAQRSEIHPHDDRREDLTFRQKLRNAGERALSEMRQVQEKKVS